MTKIISISNPKGGVGKTSTAINLAASLAIAEKSVLMIEMDPNGTLGIGWGLTQENIKGGIYEIFLGTHDCIDAIHHLSLPNLNIIPSNIFTHEQEVRLEQMSKSRGLFKRKLEDLVVKGRVGYDFIIIDTPPVLNDLTIAALYASNSVLIPLQTGFFALTVIQRLLEMVARIKNGVNPDLSIEGILINFYEKNTLASQRAVEEAKKTFGNLVLNTIIPKNTAISYAAFEKMPVIMLDATSPGAMAYLSLADEIITKNKPKAWRIEIDDEVDTADLPALELLKLAK